ncbi:MAG: YvcK family protein [Peptostreptococcaceae bacterium]|nr:YvcK family protein [Peptostreptococcaceae bacterium]
MTKNITVIGGGTGQSNLLRGLKKYDIHLSAVVTMADDGGGSGRLREEVGMLPPGDIRNCIIALSDIEPTMETLMQHRFREGSQKGQSFGNLFLAAMNEIYGDFELAVSKVSEILAVRGRVLPVTLEDVRLSALLENGNRVLGESNISDECIKQGCKVKEIQLIPRKVQPFHEVIESIRHADVIVLGPGSLYTSIIPNLLVDKVVEALRKSSAVKVYISNLMTEYGETTDYTIADHAEAIFQHCRGSVIDCIIANRKPISAYYLQKYREKGQEPLFLDEEQRRKLNEMDIAVLEEELVAVRNGFLVHDSDRAGSLVMKMANEREKGKVFYL